MNNTKTICDNVIHILLPFVSSHVYGAIYLHRNLLWRKIKGHVERSRIVLEQSQTFSAPFLHNEPTFLTVASLTCRLVCSRDWFRFNITVYYFHSENLPHIIYGHGHLKLILRAAFSSRPCKGMYRLRLSISTALTQSTL